MIERVLSRINVINRSKICALLSGMLRLRGITKHLMEKETQFIPQKEPSGVDSLFNELGSELDFGTVDNPTGLSESTAKHPLEIAKFITNLLVSVVAIWVFITIVDGTIRNLENNGFLKEIKLCSYYTFGVDNLGNAECGSYVQTKTFVAGQKEALEKDLGGKLAIVIPKKLVTTNTAKLPEVSFILQKTGNTRTSITEVTKNFLNIKNTATEYQGKDIDCEKMLLNEKGELTVRCDFYGFPLLSSDATPFTSRSTALAFLKKLEDPSSNFTLLEQPKSLEIEKFSSADAGLRSTFSTRTSLTLKVRYSPSNKL